jgi:ribonuclease D
VGGDLANTAKFLHVMQKEFNNIIDLQVIFKERYKLQNQPGLGKICEIYFGKTLNKTETCSDWMKRPLRKAQVTYAAIDARILLLIQKKMKEKEKDDNAIKALIKKLKLQ